MSWLTSETMPVQIVLLAALAGGLAACPLSGLPANSAVAAEATCGTEVGSICTPACVAGYSTVGAGPLTCLLSGEWDVPPGFECVRDCGSPDNLLPHSEVAGTCTSQLSGATCTVQCSSGYERIGGSTQIT